MERPENLLFETLFRRHVDYVCRVIGYRGVKEMHACEDLAQDVFLVVRQKLPEFRGKCSERTWLYGIARNVVSNYLRKEKRHRDLEPSVVMACAPAPQEPHARYEDTDVLDRLLSQLNEEQRMIFVLYEVEGLTTREIADCLGLNVNTVSSRLRLARQKLDALLEQEEL